MCEFFQCPDLGGRGPAHVGRTANAHVGDEIQGVSLEVGEAVFFGRAHLLFVVGKMGGPTVSCAFQLILGMPPYSA